MSVRAFARQSGQSRKEREPEGSKLASRKPGRSGQFDFHVNAGCQIELHQRVDGGGVGLNDIEQPLVSADLKLLARLLVDVRSAVDAELLDPRRKRNGPTDQRAGAASGFRNLARCLVEHTVIESLQANADILSVHFHYR